MARRLEEAEQIALMRWAELVTVGPWRLSELLAHYPAGGYRTRFEASRFNLAQFAFLIPSDKGVDLARQGIELSVSPYEEPRLDVPTYYVDTSAAYRPSLKELAAKLLDTSSFS